MPTGRNPIGTIKGTYTKRSEHWDKFLTDEQIIEEYKKRGFTRQVAMECHVQKSRVVRVIKAAGLV
jgi:hypothetical protein